MDLKSYLQQFSFEQIVAIEQQDRQFLALKQAWEAIRKSLSKNNDINKAGDVFLLMVIYNALISYQIAWSGELWREEFSLFLIKEFPALHESFVWENPRFDLWYNLMTTSRYNKRLYNLKVKRLEKFQKFVKPLKTQSLSKKWSVFLSYYQDMNRLLIEIAESMKMSTSAKTMTFAVKMFGYAARLVYDEFIPYPMWIKIPVDSRISLIVKHMGIEWNDEVQKYFQSLAEEFDVPPLHLDSLFWIEYWGKMGKKN